LSRNSKPPDVQDPNDDEIDNPNTVKPIFLQDQDMFGSVMVTKPMWVTNLHHLMSLLSLEKVDLYIFLESPLKEALAFKGRNSKPYILLCPIINTRHSPITM
jgi:hypothetical protein